MTKKLSKLKNDIVYIDPITMQKICSFNECIKKFTIEGVETQQSPKGSLYDYVVCFHECVECGRRYRSRADKKKGYNMKMDNLFAREADPVTEEVNK